jgi:hypothetical protein
MSRAPLFGTFLSLTVAALSRSDTELHLGRHAGSDTRLGYVSLPLEDLISPANPLVQ